MTWIPYLIERMDNTYEDRMTPLGLSLKPSEYWRRQGYATYQYDRYVGPLVDFIGEDNIIWGSDYPHADGTWPDSLEWIEAHLGKVPVRKKRKIIRDNVARLYGLMR